MSGWEAGGLLLWQINLADHLYINHELSKYVHKLWLNHCKIEMYDLIGKMYLFINVLLAYRYSKVYIFHIC